MANKKSDQYITRHEFNELSTKVDCLITHCKIFERHYREQQKGISEILNILTTTKSLASFIKMFGGIATGVGAIIYFFQGIKGWFKQ